MSTDGVDIEYGSGWTYLWDNSVHFRSAKERVDNFVYKVQLIDGYEQLILRSSTDVANFSASIGIRSSYTSSISIKFVFSSELLVWSNLKNVNLKMEGRRVEV